MYFKGIKMTVTPIYAGLITLLFIVLSFKVFGARGTAKVSLGDDGGKHEQLTRTLRAHGNFTEYVPLVLILMALAELAQAPVLLVHAIGVVILVGRLMHAYGISQIPQVTKLRYYGTVFTMLALLSGALTNLAMVII